MATTTTLRALISGYFGEDAVIWCGGGSERDALTRWSREEITRTEAEIAATTDRSFSLQFDLTRLRKALAADRETPLDLTEAERAALPALEAALELKIREASDRRFFLETKRDQLRRNLKGER